MPIARANKGRRRTSSRTVRDDFGRLLTESFKVSGGSYAPLVGYLRADKSVSEYTTAGTWSSFDRAVSSCFGSAARRFRAFATGSREHGKSPIVAILMLVHSNGKIVWKHRVDIPEDA